MAKVKSITVSNLKAVSALTADFNGCTAIVTGGNNKGKTSFLRSLPERLRGNKNELILKHGEKDGKAEWELTTGEKFLWEFSNGKEKLTYISERNIPSKVTKEISGTYFPPVFDVDKFLASTPQAQSKQLQQLSGIDFTEVDKMYKEAYENRTYANKVAAEAKARLVFYDPKSPTELASTEELEKELNGIEAHNLRYQGIADKVAEKRARGKQIEEQIKALQAEADVLKGEVAKGQEWMDNEANKPKTNADALQMKIGMIKKENEAVTENKRAKELQDAYDTAFSNAQQADAEVKRIEAIKEETIRMASLPTGFGFNEDGITYDGFPYNKESLSSSKLVIGALKLASKQLGEVKALYFDASYLDKNNLAEIEEWAKSEDLQLLIERPDYEGGEIHYEIIHS